MAMATMLALLCAASTEAMSCQATCEAAGHCSIGLTSPDQLPSCAMGCALAALPGVTEALCAAECTALGKPGCAATFRNLTLNKCAGVQHWTPGQHPPPGDPNPEDCGVPSVEHCQEGCKYFHGAPPAPFPPPCVPGSFGCPGDDPGFDRSAVVRHFPAQFPPF